MLGLMGLCQQKLLTSIIKTHIGSREMTGNDYMDLEENRKASVAK